MLRLTAAIPTTDLECLVKSIAPLRVTIDEERGRVITFGLRRSSSFLPRGFVCREALSSLGTSPTFRSR